MKIAIPILLIQSFTVSALAFNWSDCLAEYQGSGSMGTGVIILPFSTTTSYVSSIGDCAAIDFSNREQRKQFIAVNLETLKTETAKGGGEHLDALTKLYGCSGDFSDLFKKESKKQFDWIFRNNDPLNVAFLFDVVVLHNEILKRKCTEKI